MLSLNGTEEEGRGRGWGRKDRWGGEGFKSCLPAGGGSIAFEQPHPSSLQGCGLSANIDRCFIPPLRRN